MSSGRGRGNRNGGRRVQGQSDTNRPSNYGGLVKTVCDATSWPKEDVEKALAENDWNPDSTVDAILAGVHGMPTQEWHQVGKPKKKPTQPSGSQSEGYKGSRRAAPTITQSEGGNGGKGAPNEKRGKTPRAGFSKKPPTATPPAAAPVKVQAAPDAAAESHPQPASAPAPSVNKWASGAPSFQPKKPEPAPPAPVEHVQPKPVADLKAEPPQPEPVPEPKVVESAPVSPEPAPVPVPVHVERPSPVAAPVVEQKQPEAAGVELPGSVAAEVDPKLQFSRAKPAGDSRLGSKIELSELMSGSQEYPPEMQHMILPPGGPDMPPYMFYNPGFPPHAFDPQAHAEGDKSKEGEAGNHGPPAPYMPYPFYPPYYPPYGMGQFGGQPQYFPPSMYKQAFPFPQGFSEDGQAPPMQFYGFPMYAPPPHAGQSEGQFDGQSHGDWGQQHPAIPPMMMAPRFPGGFHQGPGQGQPGQQGQRGNRQ